MELLIRNVKNLWFRSSTRRSLYCDLRILENIRIKTKQTMVFTEMGVVGTPNLDENVTQKENKLFLSIRLYQI